MKMEVGSKIKDYENKRRSRIKTKESR